MYRPFLSTKDRVDVFVLVGSGVLVSAVYVCIHTHTHTHTRTNTHTHTHIHIYINVYYTHIHIYARTVHIHTDHTCIYMHRPTYTHAYTPAARQ